METRSLARLIRPVIRPIGEFIEKESSGGIILLSVSLLAIVLANMEAGIARFFPQIWESHLTVSINTFQLDKSLSHWINDGLMALFFLIVGLEIKREVLEGELSSIQKASLPLLAALGGMLMPALLFWAFNHGAPTAGGWGIPMATDIAFALAILALLGDRIPLPLKIFLTALAIADDLGAVLVIAVFYTEAIQLDYLAYAFGFWGGLMLLNLFNVRVLSLYLLVGLVLWYFTLKSGIHATIAGVMLAMTIPFRIRFSREELLQTVDGRLGEIHEAILTNDIQPRDISEELEDINERIISPAQKLETALHSPVAFVIIPLFAFCNTSITLNAGMFGELFSPLALGIMAGLFVGKPLGIVLFSWVSIRLGWASLPTGVTWRQLFGVAILAGIGFTMSIFVTLLAFPNSEEAQSLAKLAILLASLLAGLVGYGILYRTHQSPTPNP